MGWPFQCKLRHENEFGYISLEELINELASVKMNWLKDSTKRQLGVGNDLTKR